MDTAIVGNISIQDSSNFNNAISLNPAQYHLIVDGFIKKEGQEGNSKTYQIRETLSIENLVDGIYYIQVENSKNDVLWSDRFIKVGK